MKNKKATWSSFTWKEKRADLVPWQNPAYPLNINTNYGMCGVENYLGMAQVTMAT